jgi:hypothetical protein
MNLKEQILKNAQLINEKKEIKVHRHSNSHLFNDIKRILRETKRTEGDPSKERPKSFYKNILKQIHKKQLKRREKGEEGNAKLGTDSQRESILNSIFNDKQKMSLKDFEKGILDYAEKYPLGKPVGIKNEKGFQTVQRLIPDEKRNKTINSPMLSSFINELENEFKDYKNLDDAFRLISKVFNYSHFENSTGFVRYTKLDRGWLHFDAFQTDFFNYLKKIKFNLNKKKELTDNEKLAIKLIDYITKNEKDVFKSVVSYIVKNNTDSKQFTANTAEIAANVERVKGSGKLRDLYEKLPKELGFEKKTIEEIKAKIDTRPGKNADKLKKLLGDSTSNKPEKIEIEDVKKVLSILESKLKNKTNVTKKEVDTAIQYSASNVYFPDGEDEKKYFTVRDVLHGFTDEIILSVEKGEIKKFLNDKFNEILYEINNYLLNKGKKDFKKVWWSTRGLILENKKTIKSILTEMIDVESMDKANDVYEEGRRNPNEFDFKKGLEDLIKYDEDGTFIWLAGKDWKEFDYDKGLRALAKKKEGENVILAQEKWPKFNYKVGMDILFNSNNPQVAFEIYQAGKKWPEFDYDKGLEAIKRLTKNYKKPYALELAKTEWPKSLKQKKQELKKYKEVDTNIKRKKL